MPIDQSSLSLRLMRDEADLVAAQRLRYRVFVQELGGDGPLVDHTAMLERDALDPVFDHLLLIDTDREAAGQDHVVGAYRLLPSTRLPEVGQFYSASEFDLSPLLATGRRLLELGRSCIHPDYRGGAGMLLLWNGLADYVLERDIEILFGAASFPGVDAAAIGPSLAHLYHNHLAPPELRVRARLEHRVEMGKAPAPDTPQDRKAAMAAIPALIKAYLRLGGFVGDGAWMDRAFNTIDVCLVMDTREMSARHRSFYLRKAGREA